jgi:hypothetical protein
MSGEADRFYYLDNPGNPPREEGYRYAWGLSWEGRMAPGYSSTSDYVFLLVKAPKTEQLEVNWQTHLSGAIFETYNYRGFPPRGNSPIRPDEADSLVGTLKKAVDGKVKLIHGEHPLPKPRVEAIANFLEPRIGIVAKIAQEEGIFKIPLSRVNELLPQPEKPQAVREYFQSLFHKRDLEALEVAGLELDIPVVVLATEGQKARLRQLIMISEGSVYPERDIEIPKDKIFVEVQGEGDLTEFWSAFHILKDPEPSENA